MSRYGTYVIVSFDHIRCMLAYAVLITHDYVTIEPHSDRMVPQSLADKGAFIVLKSTTSKSPLYMMCTRSVETACLMLGVKRSSVEAQLF